MKERIQKLLANAGVDSRRNIEQMVLQGRITVNGKTVNDLPVMVDPQADKITVDGEVVRLRGRRGGDATGERIYVLMNKPKGVYTTNVSQGVQRRAIDLLPDDFPRVYPVGRLDAESKGLLLLTNDGELTHKLTHPRFGVLKTYRATVDGFVSPQIIEELEKGVWLADPKTGKGVKTARSQVKILHRENEQTILEMTLKEGGNSQIRRILAHRGHKVRELIRIKMGPLALEKLASGEFRPLSPKEVRALKEYASGRESRKPGHEEGKAKQPPTREDRREKESE